MLIDNRSELGGNSCHTGTLPSKTLRESSLALSHAIDHAFLPPVSTSRDQPITMADFTYRAHAVMSRESAHVRELMERYGVQISNGTAVFIDAHTLQLNTPGAAPTRLTGEHILIACGSRPLRPANVPFDGFHVFDSDDLLSLKRLPTSLIVLGGGVVGSEYATIFSNLGIPVQLVEGKPRHFPFIDPEIVSYLHREIVKRPLTLSLGVGITGIAISGDEAVVSMADGRTLRAESVLYALGRTTNVDILDLTRAGVAVDQHAAITVDSAYRTNIPHIAAAGDVIGFPALAATSWDQGRSAVRHLFGMDGSSAQKLLPFGIYTIPEISTVGISESDAATSGIATVIGRCAMEVTARGIISGDNGLLKLVVDRSTRALLGAQCIGARATDIIHIAMMCIRLHGTITDLTESVFNYPTVSDAVKVAALDAQWQLDALPQARCG